MCQSFSGAESRAVPGPVSCRTSPGKVERRSTWPGKIGSRPGNQRCSWLPGETTRRMAFQWWDSATQTELKPNRRGDGFLRFRCQSTLPLGCPRCPLWRFLWRQRPADECCLSLFPVWQRTWDGQNTGALSDSDQRWRLTWCRTFSAKISWSREISTTFPSICLPCTKNKTKGRRTSEINLIYGLSQWQKRVRLHFYMKTILHVAKVH